MNRIFIAIAAVVLFLSLSGNRYPEGKKDQETISSGSNVQEPEKLTRDLFLQKIWDYSKSPNEWKYQGSKPAIIDFYADWCGPCKIASPILDEINTEFAGNLVIYKVNIDQERELAQVFGISTIPAFLYIPSSGRPVLMAGIARSVEDTKKMFLENIEKYLSVKK